MVDSVNTGRRRGWKAFSGALVGLALIAVSGCAGDIIGAPDLPESPDIENAPWPRLADVPPPAELTGEDSVASNKVRGREIRADIDSEAEALLREAAQMRATPVFSDSNVEREAAEVRRRGQEIASE